MTDQLTPDSGVAGEASVALRHDLDHVTVVEVDELECDGGRADVDRDAVHAREAGGDRRVAVVDDAVGDVHRGVDGGRTRLGPGDDDAEPAFQDGERDGSFWVEEYNHVRPDTYSYRKATRGEGAHQFSEFIRFKR